MLDREHVKRKRGRASRRQDDPFLLHRCADDAFDRLLDINRNFDKALIFAAPAFSDRLISQASPDKIALAITADFSDQPGKIDHLTDETALPFADNSFDLVISGLTLHLQTDPRAALAEFKRVLKPDGVFIACLFGGATLTELRRTFYAVEDAVLGQVTPRIIPMIELQTASALLHTAGYTLPVSDRDTVHVRYARLQSLINDLRRMGETNSLSERHKAPLTRGFYDALEAHYRTHFSDEDKLKTTFEIIWLSGWKPHASQPKPLKPGSAKTRLSDALGFTETKL